MLTPQTRHRVPPHPWHSPWQAAATAGPVTELKWHGHMHVPLAPPSAAQSLPSISLPENRLVESVRENDLKAWPENGTKSWEMVVLTLKIIVCVSAPGHSPLAIWVLPKWDRGAQTRRRFNLKFPLLYLLLQQKKRTLQIKLKKLLGWTKGKKNYKKNMIASKTTWKKVKQECN